MGHLIINVFRAYPCKDLRCLDTKTGSCFDLPCMINKIILKDENSEMKVTVWGDFLLVHLLNLKSGGLHVFTTEKLWHELPVFRTE